MMNEIQKQELDVLKEFQRICDKYRLKYYAIGGTCIGAIRHSGFIPWDDDIDVAMPIDDYYRFIEVCETDLSPGFEIMNPLKIKHSSEQYIKLYDGRTTYVETFAQDFSDRYIGVFVDVFPIFGLPKSEKCRKYTLLKNDFLNKMNYLLRFPLKKEMGVKSCCVGIILKILFSFDFSIILKQQLKMLGKFRFDQSDKILFCWRLMPGTKGSGTYKNVFFYEDFCDSKKVKFEDTEICVPIGYDRYLTMDFGNYMKLPSEDKQVPKHDAAIIDFSRSYKEYQRK